MESDALGALGLGCLAPQKTFATIADHYRQRILSGDLEPGTKLPSNKEMSARWSTGRLSRVQRVQSSLMDGETSRVTAAALVVPPVYVADLFGLDPGDQVVRREYIAGRDQSRTMFAVTWYPAHFAALVPDLLSTAPGKNAGLSAKVLEATGRSVTHARDDMHSRPADARESSALGIPVGSAVLAGAHRWSDDDSVIEYGEWVLPPMFVIGYERTTVVLPA